MKTNKYFTSDRRPEKLKVKNEKEREDNNDENEEEEEDEEEEDEKNKANIQNPKTLTKPPINKDIKQTIPKREDKSRILSQLPGTFNKQRIIYHHNQNPENDSQTEGSSIRKIVQEKRPINPGITAASRILAKKDIIKTGSNHPYNLRISQNSSHSQLRNPNPQNLPPTQLKSQNSQTQMEISSKNPSKLENPSPTSFYHSKYTKRVVETSVQNDENSKEIKIINKNNNYTINVTNNNNTINVTNNGNNDNNNDANLNQNLNNDRTQNININNKEEVEKEVNIERKEAKYESKKEPRRDIRKEIRRDKRETENNYFNMREKEKKEENENQNISIHIIENIREIHAKNNNIINQEKEEDISNAKNENVNENMLEKVLPDGRKEYATNDIMIQNGVEIVKFSPEETQKVLDKKAEAQEIKKKYRKFRQNNNNKSYDYFDNSSQRGRYRVFYQRGRDNFSKRNNFERDNFYKKDKYDNFDKSFDYNDDYKDYNNKTFNGKMHFNDNKGDSRYNNRSKKFYDRGRPNQISRGFRGRRGRY